MIIRTTKSFSKVKNHFFAYFGVVFCIIFFVFSFLSFAQNVFAVNPPSVITYQGKLLENGAPVSSIKQMSFTIYDSLTGGNAKYTTAGPLDSPGTINVTPVNGIFTVDLGGSGTNALDPDIFKNNSEVYLEVTIGSETLTPRKQLTSYPYAFNSLYSSTSTFAYTAQTSTYANTSGAALTANTSTYASTANTSTFSSTSSYSNLSGTSTYSDMAGLVATTSNPSWLSSLAFSKLTGVSGNISLWTNDTNYLTTTTARKVISSSATGLTYNSSTGAFTLTSNYIIPTTASATNWNNTYNTVNANSSSWNSAAAIVSASSSKWDQIYSTVTSSYVNWNSAYSITNVGHTNWDTAYNTIINSSTRWDSAYNQLSVSATNWNNTYNTVNANSSSWNSAAAIVSASSSKWDSAYLWGNHALQGYLTAETDPIWNSVSSSYYTTSTSDSRFQSKFTTLSVSNGGTGTSTFFSGGLVYSDGSKLTQNSAKLFWDNTNGYLGVGNSSPVDVLTVTGNININTPSGALIINGTSVSDFFIDSAGDSGKVWMSDGSGKGYWGTVGTAAAASGAVGTSTPDYFSVYDGSNSVTGTPYLQLYSGGRILMGGASVPNSTSTLTVSGTVYADKISGVTLNITGSSYLGNILSGAWQGSPIGDNYILSSSTWNSAAAIVSASSSKWDSAYLWGNHALQGYLTTETDPIWNSVSSSYYTTTTATGLFEPKFNILSVSKGGTGNGSFISGGIIFGNGTGALATSSNLFWNNANSGLYVTGTIFTSATATVMGRLGIGTTTPTSALTVYGDAYLSGANRYLNFGSGSIGNSGYGLYDNGGIIQFKDNGGAWRNFSSSTLAGSNGQIQFNNNGTMGASADLIWANSILNITGDIAVSASGTFGGKVGVGTLNPTTTLSVVGTATMRDVIPESDNNYNLGSASSSWKNIYGENFCLGADCSPNVTSTFSGLDIAQLAGRLAVWADSSTSYLQLGPSSTAPSDYYILKSNDDVWIPGSVDIGGKLRTTQGFALGTGFGNVFGGDTANGGDGMGMMIWEQGWQASNNVNQGVINIPTSNLLSFESRLSYSSGSYYNSSQTDPTLRIRSHLSPASSTIQAMDITYQGLATLSDSLYFRPSSTLTMTLNPNGGVTVGSGYSTSSAIANGLVVQGNVGVGTNTPSSALTVYGDAYLSGANRYLNFGTAPTGTNGYGVRDSGGTIQFKNNSGAWNDLLSAVGTSGYISKFTGTSTLTTSSIYETFSRVGIGNIDTTGNNLFFDKSKAAFRAGWNDDDTLWSDVNVGNYSFVMGSDSLASGDNSVAMGDNAYATAIGSFALGNNAHVGGLYSMALGANMTVNGNTSFGFNLNSGAQTITQSNTFAVLGGNSGFGTTSPQYTLTSGGTLYVSNTSSLMGRVGIGTVTPEFKLDLTSDGGIIARGTSGSGNLLTTSGAGTRMIWYPRKAAFRAGSVIGTQWNDTSIGTSSVAFGENNTASATGTAVFGSGNIGRSPYGAVFGVGNSTFYGDGSFVAGNGNYTEGDYSAIFGKANTVFNGDNSFVIGAGNYLEGNSAYPSNSFMGGVTNTIYDAPNSFVFGEKNIVGASSASNLTVLGSYNYITGVKSFAIGNNVTTTGQNAMAFGNKIDVSGNYSIGFGLSASSYSLSQANTFAIMGGNVGIGTTTPSTLLTVVGSSTLQNVLPDMIGGTGNVSLYNIGASTSRWAKGWFNEVYIGSSTWKLSQNNNNFQITQLSTTTPAITILNSGNIGIGTTTPEFKLDLTNDGGIIAKGTYGSGNTLVTSGAGTRMIWYPRKAAFRAGYVDGDGWDDINIGNYSFAAGYNAIAVSTNSVALGVNSYASGLSSIAIGGEAKGGGSLALSGGISDGSGSIAIGNLSSATGSGSIAIGHGYYAGYIYKTVASGTNAIAIGFKAYANGYSSIAGGYYNTASGDYASAFGGYYNTASGDYASAFGGSSNTASGTAATAFGYHTSALADFSTAFGNVTIASGVSSTAFGSYNTASGQYSTAFGRNSIASGAYSTVFGNYNTASGTGALAFGTSNVASGFNSTAFGSNMTVNGNYSVAIGLSASSYTVPNANTMAIMGGNVGIGTTSPGYTLDVYSSSANIARFNNSTNNTNCTLTANGGTITCTSDLRLKKNVADLNGQLENVLKLRSVLYNWLNQNDSDQKIAGFIAQDVEKIYPDLVATDENGYKSLSTIGMIPYVVSAIQQQQSQIDELKLLVGAKNSSTSFDSLTVSGNAKLIKNLEVKGHTYFGEDSVGEAKILAGAKSVHVEFKNNYDKAPVITVTPVGLHNVNYGVENASTTGFDVAISSSTEEDIIFNWHAFATTKLKIHISDGRIEIVYDENGVAKSVLPDYVNPNNTDPSLGPVGGCTNYLADNFNPNATDDDGSCVLSASPATSTEEITNPTTTENTTVTTTNPVN